MPFSSTPFTSLVTDAVNAFLAATLRTMRDNLESFHNHTTGQGKQLITTSVPTASLTGAMFADGTVTSEKLLPTIVEATAVADIVISAGSGAVDVDDPGSQIVQTFPVATVVELYYMVYYMTQLNNDPYTIHWKVDGVKQASTKFYVGQSQQGAILTHHILLVAAGTRTFLPVWNKIVTNDGINTIITPRKSLLVAWSQ